MKYENMKIKKDEMGYEFADNTHMLGQEPQTCIICGCQTKVIDVLSESYICSTECQGNFDAQFNYLSQQ